jgi:hypothetical protein
MDDDLTQAQKATLKSEIFDDLTKRYNQDLSEMMQVPTFRRIISYIFMSSGMYNAIPHGNSKDIFEMGKRAFGIQMKIAIDSIENPHQMAGMELRQLAEREYTELQFGIHDHLKGLMVKGQSRPKGEYQNGNKKDK